MIIDYIGEGMRGLDKQHEKHRSLSLLGRSLFEKE